MDRILKSIGQLFIVGFPGETPPSPFLSFLQEEQIGGVILFEENCRTHLTARENIERIVACYADRLPFVAVDQEGGRVCRLRGAPAEFRPPASYAASKDVEHFVEDYSRAVVLLDSLGFNLNLAPVADIYLDPKNVCLAGRCFGSDPDTVAQFVQAAVEVAKQKGLLSCAKHFPGYGAAGVDTHQEAAGATYDELIWKQRERVPFAAAVEAGVDMIMTTHMRLPAVDNNIVTGSRKIIAEWIRTELQFDGPVITDDLCMGGAAELGDVRERAVAAFTAGHDLLLFGRDYEKAIDAYDYFVDAVRRGEIDSDAVRASLDRIAGVKFKLGRSTVS
jgi:beta-N-acetylhexosaminidase